VLRAIRSAATRDWQLSCLAGRQQAAEQASLIEHDKALQRVLVELLSDHTELFKQFSDNAAFKKWLADTIFSATYAPPTA